jgi:hypothetical protein
MGSIASADHFADMERSPVTDIVDMFEPGYLCHPRRPPLEADPLDLVSDRLYISHSCRNRYMKIVITCNAAKNEGRTELSAAEEIDRIYCPNVFEVLRDISDRINRCSPINLELLARFIALACIRAG